MIAHRIADDLAAEAKRIEEQMPFPRLALSVRQPWAYALAAGWKDVENRDWRRPNPSLNFRGECCIHASCGMTRSEYEDARDFVEGRGHELPAARDLIRGAIIGVMTVADIVRQSDSPWFFGPAGLVVTGARMIEPIPAAGALGFFEWRRAAGDYMRQPAKWMQVGSQAVNQPCQSDALFEIANQRRGS